MTAPSHQTIRLGRGRHSSPADGACVMELASMLAGEPFSDRPESVCPVIGAFLRTYNDAIDDHRRQDLYGYAALSVGTRAPSEVARRRKRLCLDRAAAPKSASRVRRMLTGSAAAGQAAARSFLTPAGARHQEALAFLNALVDERPRELVDEEARAEESADTLTRLGSH